MDDRVLENINAVETGRMAPDAARVAISALQWRAGKLKPKKYGDTSRLEHTGEGGGPILISPARRQEITERLLSAQGVLPKPDEDET